MADLVGAVPNEAIIDKDFYNKNLAASEKFIVSFDDKLKNVTVKSYFLDIMGFEKEPLTLIYFFFWYPNEKYTLTSIRGFTVPENSFIIEDKMLEKIRTSTRQNLWVNEKLTSTLQKIFKVLYENNICDLLQQDCLSKINNGAYFYKNDYITNNDYSKILLEDSITISEKYKIGIKHFA
jgi:hypothetical protein